VTKIHQHVTLGVVSDATEATKREGKGSSAPRQSADEPQLSRGTLVGRYVILDVIGEGGMGVVYAAFDPELDRKVAVKLLQASASGSESGGQAWLMREAQAMARLSHPNVISVHDVGTLAGDRVFVAMELVDGGTLRKWMEGEHTWREVVAVMRAAGAGLAAAHAAGLVHRDFKPDNVLVGKDGRVRVMDFGLARLHDGTARDSDLTIEAKSPLSEKLTIAGTVVGTPAYMAPEMYDEHGADARTDQFAFGVTLYEALYRARPFDKRELAAGDPGLKPKPPPQSKVPARLHEVVTRAIAIDPAARFSSMDELLAALAIDPTAARRRAALVAGGVLVVGGLVAGGMAMMHSRGALCTGAERKLAGAWDAPTKQTIQQAFAATKHVRAAASFESVSRVLDRYAHEWTETSVESCKATRVHGDQTEADMSLRSDCLDGRLAELRALTQLFAKADTELVDKAAKAASGLDPISTCSNLPVLRTPAAPPPGQRDNMVKLQELIASAKAAVLANKLGTGLVKSGEAVELAKSSHYDPALAEALMLRGTAAFSGGDPLSAAQDMTDGALAAIRGKREDILAAAAFYAAIVASQNRNDDVAKVWLGVGIAAQSHVTSDAPLEVRRYEAEGIVRVRAGDLAPGLAADEKAVELASKLYGEDGALLLAQAELELASAYVANQLHAKALPHLEHVLALLEKAEGPDHPDIATALGTLGMVQAHAGEIEKARATYERAIAIREKALGKTSPVLVPTLNNIADMLNRNGDSAHALTYVERAVAMSAAFGKTNTLYLTVQTTHAEVLAGLRRFDESRKLFDEILAAEDKTHPAIYGNTLASRAQAELDDHKPAEAVAFAERSIAFTESTVGKDSPLLWVPLATLAQAKAELGKPDEAKPLFERAFAIAKSAQTSEADLAAAKAAYAKLK
jgi:tetratricopeptide (TPR) repeat protein